MEDKKRRRKGVVAAVLSLCLVLVAVAGVVAYLTSTSSLTNTFTVGGITPPTTDPDDPNPDDPLDPDGDEKNKLSGNLFEKKWVPDTAIAAGQTNVAKDPQVGIGYDSENCYVFIYVKNNTVTGDVASTGAYFTIENGWAAATDTAAEPTKSTAVEVPVGTTAYVDGLFVYGNTATAPDLLESGKTQNNDGSTEISSWTGPLFSAVSVPGAAVLEDSPEIKVYAYLYAPTANEIGADALTAAKAWAEQLATS